MVKTRAQQACAQRILKDGCAAWNGKRRAAIGSRGRTADFCQVDPGHMGNRECPPQQILWTIIVLLPKGGGDYRGIGLVDPFWKVREAVMDNSPKTLDYHDCLHGFLVGCSTGTVTTKVKLAQQLAYIKQVRHIMR